MKKINVSPYALDELAESIEFYNSKNDGLGDEFSMLIEQSFTKL